MIPHELEYNFVGAQSKESIGMILLFFMVHIFESSFVTAKCTFSNETFRCRGTDYNFLDTFYKFLPDDLPTDLSFEIVDSRLTVIKYFTNPVVDDTPYKLRSVAIRNSSVQLIFKSAFEELKDLEILDLSSNTLIDISFVEFLSAGLKKLYLNDNKITNVEHVFNHFEELELLEMTKNKISVLDFSAICRVRNVDISRNFIARFESGENINECIHTIDLSYNHISEFDETKLGTDFVSLDLSHNHLRSLRLRESRKNTLNICNNSMIFLSGIYYVDNFILSSNEFEITRKLNVVVFKELAIKNSSIFELSMGTADILESIRSSPELTIDLSFTSIRDITEYYFQHLRVKMLNLSYNNISTLGSNIFLDSIITSIDFSHSNIEYLRPGVFDDVKTESINLSFNGISSIRKVFHRVYVAIINLSFNRIEVIDKYSFTDCVALTEIILSNCGIEKIEKDSFANLSSLRTIDLSNNMLLILERDTFHDLHMATLNLQNNRIKTIRTQAFNNLPHLSELNLSGLYINSLEMHAFNNLPSLTTLDLSNNEISVIPPTLFSQMHNLYNIELSGNNITILHKFSNELRLKKLSISYNGSFTANKISNLHIRYLSIQKSMIDVLGENSFDGLYNLKELHFTQSDVLFVDQGALNDLYNLEFLDAQNLFKYTKHIKKNTFSDLRSLPSLNLSNLNLETIESSSFEGLKKLKYLMLNNNNVVNIRKDVFIGSNVSEILDLSRNMISNIYEGVFRALPHLKKLNLEYNKLTELSSNMFAGMKSLEVLNLKNNDISFITSHCFSEFANLRKLFLQNNEIKKIPTGSFQYLSKLMVLNLSFNHFELIENGLFSNLKNLRTLDLSNTSLIKLEEVSIFFSMMNLEKLYLDRNHLKQLDMRRLLNNLKNIIYVGISHNKWTCNTLSLIIETMNNKSVGYQSSAPIYDYYNIDGIQCVDICEFVYCAPEHGEPNRVQ
ncbi:unnamed protein product [Phaedon cochleariae]|uniref:Chaoptin n=1 Tax=Phaedon cochleariae TaxID=80249 RepID=A0A9P0DU97_PHACE|nr:unnamed protein product [Phaedon cochleariae]